jgi:hypothetical protein
MTMNNRSGIAAMIEKSAKLRGLKGPNFKGEWRVCCPLCFYIKGTSDDKYKMQLNVLLEVFYCFRCGQGGHVSLRWLGGSRAAEIQAEQISIPLPINLGPPKGFIALDKQSISLMVYRNYLKDRGVLDQAIAAGVGVTTCGRFRGRVIFPSKDSTGKWLGFSARAVFRDMDPKYLYPTGMDKKGHLWGWEHFSRDVSTEVWLVEGVFDSLPLFPHALSSYGKNVSDAQLDLLVPLDLPIVVCLDGDAWEECRILAARLRLRGAKSVMWARLPPTEDSGNLGWRVREFIQKDD